MTGRWPPISVTILCCLLGPENLLQRGSSRGRVIAWRATTMHPWRGPCGVSQDRWARGSMVRNDRRSCARYDSAAAV
jgi:hypothetical protein